MLTGRSAKPVETPLINTQKMSMATLNPGYANKEVKENSIKVY